MSEKVQKYYDEHVKNVKVDDTAASTPPVDKPLAVQRIPGKSLRVLFSGDSLTGGLYASSQATAFQWLMVDALKKSGPIEQMSSALSGGTTVEVSQKYTVPGGLDLAVVELGTNDKAKATPISDFRAAYVDLLNKITAGSPGVALVCAGVWEDVNGGPDALPYNNVISSECTARGGRFVNLTPIYKNPATIGPVGVPSFGGVSDNFHPNDTGHRAIADALLAQIKVG
ncbi:SGNH/GDSL hydrolase family protein [Arthrobacter liuii]|uniref:SGNH hydrolase-type esterase domain-containing protein n=1 Tax=Arthrobacter liuii TaxID=1476996 RepID=A0ABQ2APJ2_9MICC|nr:SGNH/GDSL hydrolase family protein [Arthrobacter liuii]GGH93718.1 hypothetical protein GCM10007170_15240 [Arthrobacter liuii]